MKELILKTDKIEKKIGAEHPVFIIAEVSANHDQDYDKALKIIDAAIEAGADAIKLQTYTADTMTLDCDNDYFQVKVNDAWKGQSLYSLYKIAYTPWDWQPKLKKYVESKGVLLFSTPFDVTAVDFLEKMDVAFYKVASFEVNHIPLLKKIGSTKKPVIMSRGMSTVEEIEMAIKTLKDAGCPGVCVLHCVSSYPAKPGEMNLSTIPDIAKKFDVLVGLSDHTLGTTVATAAIPLGARVIEKHVTLSRADGGPDAAFSLEPGELKQLVKAIRETEVAIGKPSYGVGKKESENHIFRPSIWAYKDIKKGDVFSEDNIIVRRPGQGLAPKHYEDVLGKKSLSDIKKCNPLKKESVEGFQGG